LGGGSGSVAFEFDPGPRLGDLSPALPILAELNFQLDMAMSLRVARIALESAVLNPADQGEALAAAQDFCRSTKRLTEMRVAEKKSA
jgi:hypothetical protein